MTLKLTPEEVSCLEELYLHYRLAGVTAQNTPTAAGRRQVWNSGLLVLTKQIERNRIKQ